MMSVPPPLQPPNFSKQMGFLPLLILLQVITITTSSHLTLNITEKYQIFGSSTKVGRLVQIAQGQSKKEDILMAPALIVDEDELVTTTVRNHMYSKSLTIHHHGLHQHGTPWMDGVPGLSQTLISAGETYVYKFLAHPAGTHFYHTHVAQLGLRGPFIVKAKVDPHISLYDKDETILLFSDLSKSRDEATWLAGLVSGLLMSNEDPESDMAWDDTLLMINGIDASLNVIKVDEQNRYRFRLINGAFNWALEMSIQGHSLLIIASDGKDCEPQLTKTLVLSPGERYDIVLKRDYISGSNKVPVPSTYKDGVYIINLKTRNGHLVKAKLQYENIDGSAKAIQEKEYTPIDKIDISYNSTLLHAHSETTPLMPSNTMRTIKMKLGGNMKNYEWTINGMKWSLDNLNLYLPLSLLKGIFDSIVTDSIIQIPLNDVVDIHLSNPTMMQHPFHIHGHKFWVLNSQPINSHATLLSKPNDRPVYKDTINVPPSHIVSIRVKFDNPGPWLFHCHTSFHLNRGMAVVFMVGNAEDQPTPPSSLLKDNNKCPSTKSSTTTFFSSRTVGIAIGLLCIGVIIGYVIAAWQRKERNYSALTTPTSSSETSSETSSPTGSNSTTSFNIESTGIDVS